MMDFEQFKKYIAQYEAEGTLPDDIMDEIEELTATDDKFFKYLDSHLTLKERLQQDDAKGFAADELVKIEKEKLLELKKADLLSEDHKKGLRERDEKTKKLFEGHKKKGVIDRVFSKLISLWKGEVDTEKK